MLGSGCSASEVPALAGDVFVVTFLLMRRADSLLNLRSSERVTGCTVLEVRMGKEKSGMSSIVGATAGECKTMRSRDGTEEVK